MTRVVARSIPTKFDVIFSGAGISIDAPSNLRDANGLIEATLDALHGVDPSVMSGSLKAEVLKRIQEERFDIRMEQFLDVLSGPQSIPVRTLVNVYGLVGTRAYNRNHLRLAALDANQITVNMDTLIEEAGVGVSVKHLHGKWDKPKSIKTTVTQYAHGLPSATRRAFGRAIHNANVLVIGYSGRDIDVMPLFHQYPPASITWAAPTARRLEVEARELRESRREAGLEFIPVARYAGRYLPTLAHGRFEPDPHAEVAAPVNMVEIMAKQTTSQQRTLGVAALLNTIGLTEQTSTLLDSLSFHGAAETRRRKLLAQALTRRGLHVKALGALLPGGGGILQLLSRPGALSDITIIARRAGEDGLSSRAEHLLRLPFRHPVRRLLLARVRTAQQLAVSGDLDVSVSLFLSVTRRRNAARLLGPSNLVDALTWHADALKTRGDLREAAQIAARANQLAPYGDQSQRAYALWKGAEIAAIMKPSRGSSSDGAEKVRKGLHDAIHFAERSGSSDALAWLNGTLAEYLARSDPAGAQSALTAAAKARNLEDRAHGPAYMLLQHAIVALASGDHRTAKRYKRLASERAKQDNPAVFLQARQLELHMKWLEKPESTLAGEMEDLATEFELRKLHLSAARSRAAAAMVRGVRVPTEILERAAECNWDPGDFGRGRIKWPSERRFYILV